LFINYTLGHLWIGWWFISLSHSDIKLQYSDFGLLCWMVLLGVYLSSALCQDDWNVFNREVRDVNKSANGNSCDLVFLNQIDGDLVHRRRTACSSSLFSSVQNKEENGNSDSSVFDLWTGKEVGNWLRRVSMVVCCNLCNV